MTQLVRHILSISLCFFTIATYSQQLQFSNVSNSLSIPSLACYNIMQDSKGYIWFSTEAGLCKYDGNALKIFDKKNGLPEGATYAIYEFKKMLWFITSKNRILVYKNDELHEPPFSKEYQNILNNDFAITYRIDVKNDSTFYITSRMGTYELDLKTKKIKPYPGQTLLTQFLFVKTKNQIIPIANRPTEILNDVMVTVLHKEEKKEILLNNKLYSSYWRVETRKIGRYDFIGCNDHLIRFDENLNHTILQMPNRILSLQTDKDNGLWVGIYRGGVYYYPNINDLSVYKHGLDDISVSGTCQDRENNVWCSTLEKGIYFCHNKNITDYSNIEALKNAANLLKNENGHLFVATDGTSLFEIGNKVQEYRFNEPPSFVIFDIKKHLDGWLLTGYGVNNYLNKKFNVVYKHNNSTSISYFLSTKPNGEIVGVNFDHFQIVGNRKTFKIYKFSFDYAARSILCDSKGNIWIGSDAGIHSIDPKNYTIKHVKKTEKISKIIEDSRGNIWFPTKGTGLFLKIDTGIYQANKILQIPTEIFYDITEDKDKNIWLGTNIGLVKIQNTKNGHKTHIYTTKHGLPSNVIYKVAANEKEIFFSSTEGLTCFPLSVDLLNTTPPKIYVNAIMVDGTNIYKNSNSYTFPYDCNSIHIKFDIPAYKDLSHGKLMYKLKGRDKKFHAISGNSIIMDNLEPDNYQLEVYGLNSDGVKSEKPILISIEIKKPFWRTAWFITIAVIFLTLALYAAVRKIIINIRKKEEAKTHINKMLAEYQLGALQAQMNPHFIFNAINSIQSYILRKDEEQAYEYLAKFSKLIRMVLNNSEEKILTLQQELETLDLYIQLEKLRFDNKFEYKLNIDEQVNPNEVMVPAMLLQPYVENAIWHGLMNLDDIKKGILSIKILYENNTLVIWVEDNGVGRTFTNSQSKQRGHKSIGMQLGEKRLMMLARLKDFENAHVSVIDLTDENGKPGGTRIEIYLPINWA